MTISRGNPLNTGYVLMLDADVHHPYPEFIADELADRLMLAGKKAKVLSDSISSDMIALRHALLSDTNGSRKAPQEMVIAWAGAAHAEVFRNLADGYITILPVSPLSDMELFCKSDWEPEQFFAAFECFVGIIPECLLVLPHDVNAAQLGIADPRDRKRVGELLDRGRQRYQHTLDAPGQTWSQLSWGMGLNDQVNRIVSITKYLKHEG